MLLRWKLFDETKRGGSFVKAAWETTEKDIQGNVSDSEGYPRTEIARIASQ